MLLEFWGIKLDITSAKGGIPFITKAVNWVDRFENLNQHSHNNLRITRLLTALGPFGFHLWRDPILQFLETVILVEGHLPRCRNALEKWWKQCADVNSQNFIERTRETEADRLPSIWFQQHI
jgi:hypothetical protein